MGVAVLQPQDCLRNPTTRKPLISPPPKMKLPNPTPKSSSRTSRNNPNRQKRAQHGSNQTRPASSTSDAKPQLNKLVMGQVKILKRGEQLTQTAPDTKAETVKEAFRSAEQPLTESVGGLYAGSSMCVASPPPTSVPLPLFITKKIVAVSDATNDLRKMLRLEFS